MQLEKSHIFKNETNELLDQRLIFQAAAGDTDSWATTSLIKPRKNEGEMVYLYSGVHLLVFIVSLVV